MTNTPNTNTPNTNISHSASTPRPSRRRRLATVALPLAAAALAMAACDVDIEFNEETVQQTFDLDSFAAVTIDAPFDVTIRQGDTQSVSVEVGDSLVDDLVVEVVDGELRIDLDSGSFNIGRDLSATITMSDLDSLHASSASDIVVVDFDVDDLTVRTDEASQFSMSGSIDTLDLDMSEASQADLDGTTIGTVSLEMSGASQADFPETVDAIDGSIRGASSLDVDDATNVRVDTSGASSIDRN